MKLLSKLRYFTFAIVLYGPVAVVADGNCYRIDHGPMLRCMEDGGEVITMQSFRAADGRLYRWSNKASAYCFKNDYGKERCKQNWSLENLTCDEEEDGLVCR